LILIRDFLVVPIPWSQVVRRTVHEIREDNCFGLAAQLAFYFLALILIGPYAASDVADWLRVGAGVAVIWSLLRWPLMIVCVVLGVDLVYYFAPNRRARWAWVTPGSVLATALWIVSSFAFKLYVVNVGEYTATYGAIGAAIVTLLWFYVSSIAILIGAELNGVIEGAWRSERARTSG
jgi:membrane protein